MKKILYILFAFYATGVFAHDKYLSFKDGYVGKTDFKVAKTIKEGTSYIDVTYTFGGAYIDNYNSQNKYQQVSVPNSFQSNVKGDPELPYLFDTWAIGSLKGVQVTQKSAQYKEFGSINVVPSKGISVSSLPQADVAESATYKTNKFFPTTTTELVETSQMRGVPLAGVRLYPIQFNPVTKKIRCYTSITYRISYSGSTNNVKLSKTFKDVVKGKVSNPEVIENKFSENSSLKSSKTISTADIDRYLIVTTNSLLPAAKKLAKWKSMQGYKCRIISKSKFNTDQEVRDSLYKDYSKNGIPAYLLILGNHNGFVPGKVFSIYHNRTDFDSPLVIYTDKLYANSGYILNKSNVSSITTSNANNFDCRPDIMGGRITVSSLAQANTVIDKIIRYEKTPPADDDFYENVVCAAYFQDITDPQKGKKENGWADQNFIEKTESVINTIKAYSDINPERIYSIAEPPENNRLYLPQNSYIPVEYTQSWDLWNYRPEARHKVIDQINKGTNFIFYSGHGAEHGWYSIDLDMGYIYKCGEPGSTIYCDEVGMTNGEKLPYFFGGIACKSGTFNSTCFATNILLKETGGGVGIIANSSYGWTPTSVNQAEKHMKKIFKDKENNIGKSLLDTWYDDLSNESSFPYKSHISLTTHTFGDPDFNLYTAVPICFHPTIKKSGNNINVKTGVADCKITLTDMNDPTRVDRMHVMEGDDVTFQGITYPYIITIQKRNHVPYITTGTDVYIQNYTFSSSDLTEILGKDIYAGSDITSTPTIGSGTGTVNVTGKVNFRAANGVKFRPGFKAANGSTMKAFISGDCHYSGNESQTAMLKTVKVDNVSYEVVDADTDDADQGLMEELFQVYPNPTTGLLNVSVGEQTAQIRVFDLYGRQISNIENAKGVVEIDLSDERRGFYAITIDSENYHLTYKVVLK